MASNPIRKWTVEDYLAFDEESDIKHEFMDGEIYAMSGGTRKHSVIIANISGALWQATKGTTCRTHSSEMRVKIGEDYFYPDVSAVCETEEFEDEKELALLNPTVVIEVTSKSSQNFDKGIKADLYRSLDSVQAYLVVEQNQCFAQLSTRHDEGWLLRQFDQIHQSIPLAVLNLNLPMSDVYLDVEFES